MIARDKAMKQVEIADGTYDRLVVAARLMDRTVGEVVAQLVDWLASDEPGAQPAATVTQVREAVVQPASVAADPGNRWIPVFKIYKSHRLDGVFNRSTHEVRITTEPWGNKVFSSPT